MELTASIIDLESVAPEDRKNTFARHAAEHIQAQEFGAVVERIRTSSELRPADGESDSDFIKRLHTDGAVSVFYSPLEDTPFRLFYLHNKPLIGFLPPDIGRRKIDDDTSAMTITINVVQAELMPQWGDTDGVKRLLISFMLSKLLVGKV
jgi:hypothetical protein